jgi:hypothetical protein
MSRKDQAHLVLVTLPRIPASTAALGTGTVAGVLAGGTVPASSPLAWQLVVLALGSMAYDLGLRALRIREAHPS